MSEELDKAKIFNKNTGHASARVASAYALISIAESLERIADVACGARLTGSDQSAEIVTLEPKAPTLGGRRRERQA